MASARERSASKGVTGKFLVTQLGVKIPAGQVFGELGCWRRTTGAPRAWNASKPPPSSHHLITSMADDLFSRPWQSYDATAVRDCTGCAQLQEMRNGSSRHDRTRYLRCGYLHHPAIRVIRVYSS